MLAFQLPGEAWLGGTPALYRFSVFSVRFFLSLFFVFLSVSLDVACTRTHDEIYHTHDTHSYFVIFAVLDAGGFTGQLDKSNRVQTAKWRNSVAIVYLFLSFGAVPTLFIGRLPSFWGRGIVL